MRHWGVSILPCIPSPLAKADRRAVLGLFAGLALAGCMPPHETRLIVGSSAGGGNDDLARLFAKTLLRQTSERLTVENEGKAGGKLALDHLAASPVDGTTLGLLAPSFLYRMLQKEVGASWSLSSFGWIGGVSAERRVLVVNARSGIRTLDDLLGRKTPVTLAASSVASPNYIEPLIINQLLGTRLKPVPGYSGGARTLAVMSGEVDGMVTGFDSVGPLLDAPGNHILLRLNSLELPGKAPVPTLASMAKGPDAADLLDLIETSARIGQVFAMPPNPQAQALPLWTQRFHAVIEDPDFRREAGQRGMGLEATTGREIATALARLANPSGPTLEALSRVMAKGRAG